MCVEKVTHRQDNFFISSFEQYIYVGKILEYIYRYTDHEHYRHCSTYFHRDLHLLIQMIFHVQ